MGMYCYSQIVTVDYCKRLTINFPLLDPKKFKVQTTANNTESYVTRISIN